jgi:hypothetical protein
VRLHNEIVDDIAYICEQTIHPDGTNFASKEFAQFVADLWNGVEDC